MSRLVVLSSALVLILSQTCFATVRVDEGPPDSLVFVSACFGAASGMIGGLNLEAARRGDRSLGWSVGGLVAGVGALAFAMPLESPLVALNFIGGGVGILGGLARLPRGVPEPKASNAWSVGVGPRALVVRASF